ncbi:MAG: L,D-transpeptidase [Bdellovibrionales bacterium]|nr:L,D-transpeptidase [Bdellovibrionales bacterium]
MKALFTIILLTITSITFAQDMAGASQSTARPVDIDVTFNESTFESQPWTKEFRYVIVVNKANTGKEAQLLKIFEFGELIRTEKISTGRDAFEKKGENHSKADSWTVTPTGYYTPSYLDKDHRSGAYGGRWSWLVGGTKMPFAIFFNGGIALHEAPKGTEPMLGKKASGGCVRLPASLASDLFTRVQETEGSKNPRFNVNGTAMLDANGQQLYSTKSGFATLIVVQNKVLE